MIRGTRFRVGYGQVPFPAKLDSGTNVVGWHDDLKPNPADNANIILAYHNRGLLAWMGRQWVCWGDLRTEYVRSRDLRTKLQTKATE